MLDNNHSSAAITLKPMGFLRAVIGLLFCALSSAGFTLPSDSQQAITINSNSAIRDDKLGVTIYEGNVDMVQGSMQITANKVTIYTEQNKVSKIIAEGDQNKRAYFKQQPSPDKGNVEAEALTIEYLIANEKITLLDDALLTQADGSTIASDKIFYDVNAARVEASSENGQVTTVINPQNTFE